MGQLRITGIVRTAERVRQTLAGGLTDTTRITVEKTVQDAIQFVDQVLAKHGMQLDQLLPPTRRAYAFLKSLDFANLPTMADPAGESKGTGSLRIGGLRTNWERLLARVAKPLTPDEEQEALAWLTRWHDSVMQLVNDNDLDLGRLPPSSGVILGWMRYFVQLECFAQYCTAIRHATTALAAIEPQTTFRLEFSRASGLYEMRRDASSAYIRLATPMVTLNAPDFANVAAVVLGRADRRLLRSLPEYPEWRAMDQALRELSGQVDRTAGAFHDLAASFRRVNVAYFEGRLTAPRLTWNRIFTGRKFGHYEPRRDQILLSCSLDRGDVPAWVVDFVMYHELLHRVLGVQENNGRCEAHTPEFRARERRYGQFEAADAFLLQLARET